MGPSQNKYSRATGQPGSAAMNNSRQQLAVGSSQAPSSSNPSTQRGQPQAPVQKIPIITGSTIKKKTFMNLEGRMADEDNSMDDFQRSDTRGQPAQNYNSSSFRNGNSSSNHHHQQQHHHQDDSHHQQYRNDHHSDNNSNKSRVQSKSIGDSNGMKMNRALSEGKKHQPARQSTNPASSFPELSLSSSSQRKQPIAQPLSRGQKQTQLAQNSLQTVNGQKSRDENNWSNNSAPAAAAAASKTYSKSAKKAAKEVKPTVIDLAGDSDDNSDDDVEVCNEDNMDVADAKDGSHRQLASPGKQKFGNSYPPTYLTTVYLDTESFVAPIGQTGSGNGHRMQIVPEGHNDDWIIHFELREAIAVVGTDGFTSSSSSSSFSSSSSSSSASRANNDVKQTRFDVSFRDIHKIT